MAAALNTARLYAGILSRTRAFTGPPFVQIDITNRCNNNCLYCWARSPLLKEKLAPPAWQQHTIPTDRLLALLNELRELNVRHIHLAGGGEPMVHPGFWQVAQAVKHQGMELELTTNFTLCDQDTVARLAGLPVDYLTASFWAATGETYVALHPSQSRDTFTRMVAAMTRLCQLKKRQGGLPVVRVVFVISRINYREIPRMLELAAAMGVDHILFQVMDPVIGYTDNLLLSHDEKAELLHTLAEQQPLIDSLRHQNIALVEFDHFRRRLQSSAPKPGSYDQEITEKIPCYCGWIYCRITAEGNVNFCLKTDEYPLGNILRAPFRDIWFSPAYNRFRQDRLNNVVDPDKPLRCHTTCDNLSDNLLWHQRVRELSNPASILSAITEKKNAIRQTLVRQEAAAARNYRDYLGLQTGTLAFNAPYSLSICPTATCDTNCLICWHHSPLLKPEQRLRLTELAYPVLKNAVDYCLGNGTRIFFLTGGGEPLLYPGIRELISHICSNPDVECKINTNFIRIARDDAFADFIRHQRINTITASLLAGSEETFRKIHPGSAPGTFGKCLQRFSEFNARTGENSHRIVYHNVIFSENQAELEQMVEHARNTGCFAVKFNHMHEVRGFNDQFTLTAAQAREMLPRLAALAAASGANPGPRLLDFDDFIRRTRILARADAHAPDRDFEYDRPLMGDFSCHAGWAWAQINQDGNVTSCCRMMESRGNLYESDFATIWNGPHQQRFRRQTRHITPDKIREYGLPCHTLCDNLQDNLWFAERIKGLDQPQLLGGSILGKVINGADAVLSSCCHTDLMTLWRKSRRGE